MTMDYNTIRIPVERITTMHGHTANYKLKRLMFAISLYPDWKLASIFAGIPNYGDFLEYWLGKEASNEIKKDVSNRKQLFSETDGICIILENAFSKYNAGLDYLNPFLTDDEYIEQEFEPANPLMTQEEMMHLIGLELDWSYETILNRVEDLIEMERIRRNTVIVESGKYWIIAYRQVPLKGILKPFVLLARVSIEHNYILTIQGLWPIEFMKKTIDKEVPLPYTATMDDLKYIRVETEPTKKGPHMYKYKSIQTWKEEESNG